MAKLLVLADYSLDKNDSELGYLTTAEKPIGQLTPAKYGYRVVAKPEGSGTALTVTGQYSIPVGLRTITESMYWTKGNLPHAKQCFAAIEKVVLQYPDAKFSYSAKP